jgi:hypothetical protein
MVIMGNKKWQNKKSKYDDFYRDEYGNYSDYEVMPCGMQVALYDHPNGDTFFKQFVHYANTVCETWKQGFPSTLAVLIPQRYGVCNLDFSFYFNGSVELTDQFQRILEMKGDPNAVWEFSNMEMYAAKGKDGDMLEENSGLSFVKIGIQIFKGDRSRPNMEHSGYVQIMMNPSRTTMYSQIHHLNKVWCKCFLKSMRVVVTGIPIFEKSGNMSWEFLNYKEGRTKYVLCYSEARNWSAKNKLTACKIVKYRQATQMSSKEWIPARKKYNREWAEQFSEEMDDAFNEAMEAGEFDKMFEEGIAQRDAEKKKNLESGV